MTSGLTTLELSFLVVVGAMTAASGLFAAYVLLQLFRGHSRR